MTSIEKNIQIFYKMVSLLQKTNVVQYNIRLEMTLNIFSLYFSVLAIVLSRI